MAKFVALYNRLMLSVPYVKKDESGNTVENRTLSFNSGSRVNQTINPAYLSPKSEEEVEYLRKYAGNEANGGTSFKEIKVKAVAPAAPAAPVKTVVPPVAPKAAVIPPTPVAAAVAPAGEPVTPAVEPGASDTTDENKDSDIHTYDEVVTVQAAFAVLKTYDLELKSVEHRSFEAINASAEKLNVAFPNLAKKK